LNALQRRLFEEARRKNPDLKVPVESEQGLNWTEADLALIKQGVGDKSRKSSMLDNGDATSEGQPAAGTGWVVTYFEDKGFGFLRPDNGGRDIFFHVSKLTEGAATELRPGTRVIYELGMDRSGKMAASSVRIARDEKPSGSV
jgi:CspA family cold shock protein